MNKKIIKRSLLAIGALFILLGAVLVIHIYMVTQPQKGYFKGIMMGRIDFKEKIDPEEATEIRHFVNSLEGVQKSYFNDKDNILVFSYHAEKQDPESVYKAVMNHGNYIAKRYIASNTDSGCPVIDKSSFTYKAGAFIQNIFK